LNLVLNEGVGTLLDDCLFSRTQSILVGNVSVCCVLSQICQVDRADEGGLPPYVLALMVIYFLQQRTEPLLPTYLNFDVGVVCVCVCVYIVLHLYLFNKGAGAIGS